LYFVYNCIIIIITIMDKPTRTCSGDEPHILDLVLTNGPFIDNIEYFAPLG